MTAPKSVSGSLLVCRVDSPWTHTFRLYLTPNDPPERVMREQQGKRGKTGSEGGYGVSEGERGCGVKMGRRGRTEAARERDEI